MPKKTSTSTPKSTPKNDAPMRQRAVARWENEGGAPATNHEPSTINAIYTHAVAITKKRAGIGTSKKADPKISRTKQP